MLVSRKMLKAKGFFRTAFYFPSVTSSVAITTLWLFLFSATGAVNAFLAWFGLNGPNWFNDPRGVIHIILGNPERARIHVPSPASWESRRGSGSPDPPWR